jgi:hypothetical protein
MMKPNLREFFEAFMSMFAGPVYQITRENSDSTVGELIWPSEPGYREEVRWDCAEADVPSITCFRLASFIAEQDCWPLRSHDSKTDGSSMILALFVKER